MHIALVEPNYYSQFPPIGLLKLSTVENNKGNTTELIKKNNSPTKKPDKIYITSLFTWAWRPVWETVRKYKSLYPDVEITLGGLYASLLPEHAKLSGANIIFRGLNKEAEEVLPDYGLVPEWNGSIIFASRGCKNKCIYCAVPKLEGTICSERRSIKKYIYQGHTKLIFFDNNILAMKYWEDIFKEVIELKMEVDYNQGLDARLIDQKAASLIAQMKIPTIRLAYDHPDQKDDVEKSITLLHENGVDRRNILVYTLFNFTESPDDFLSRVLDIFSFGAVCYPMRFQPLTVLDKDEFVSKKWEKYQLEMVARARRVIGYGGAFPPYEGLIKKLKNARNFDEAFELYPKKDARA